MARFYLVLFLLVFFQGSVSIYAQDSNALRNQDALIAISFDSVLEAHPMLKDATYLSKDTLRQYDNQSFDLYIILFIIILFGSMRYLNARYYQYLLRAFRSPSFGSQQLKDQIRTAALPNLLMNFFFAISAGTYLFYLFKLSYPQRYLEYTPSILLFTCITGVLLLYGAKFVFLRFSSWAFNIKSVVSHYLYNVFLINKVLAVVLLPFTVLMAFTHNSVAYPSMIISMFLVIILFVSRYVRSWQVVGGFFLYNRFHFFAYLCASELLPMAILTKLLISGVF